MELIGQYDSPFVRRTAIAFHIMGLDFRHNPLSVFSDYAVLHAINPAVKVPTLITDDGTVLQDSSLILEYAERLAPEKSLLPRDTAQYLKAQRITGLALAANEKAVALVYEQNLRPAEKRHQPWLDRVTDQLHGALKAQEDEAAVCKTPWLCGEKMQLCDITAAVSFRFIKEKLTGQFSLNTYPHLAALSAKAEATEAFLACPYPAE